MSTFTTAGTPAPVPPRSSGLRPVLLALGVAAGLASAVPAGAQYATYTGTYFVPGLNETSAIWTTGNTPNRLAERVELGTRHLPTLTSYESINFQTTQLAGLVRAQPAGATFFFVGHSMGGVLSRNLLLSSDPAVTARSVLRPCFLVRNQVR